MEVGTIKWKVVLIALLLSFVIGEAYSWWDSDYTSYQEQNISCSDCDGSGYQFNMTFPVSVEGEIRFTTNSTGVERECDGVWNWNDTASTNLFIVNCTLLNGTTTLRGYYRNSSSVGDIRNITEACTFGDPLDSNANWNDFTYGGLTAGATTYAGGMVNITNANAGASDCERGIITKGNFTIVNKIFATETQLTFPDSLNYQMPIWRIGDRAPTILTDASEPYYANGYTTFTPASSDIWRMMKNNPFGVLGTTFAYHEGATLIPWDTYQFGWSGTNISFRNSTSVMFYNTDALHAQPQTWKLMLSAFSYSHAAVSEISSRWVCLYDDFGDSGFNATFSAWGGEVNDSGAPTGTAVVFNQPEGSFLDYEITYNWTFYNFTDNPAPCWSTLNDTTESLGNFATADSVQGTWNMSMGTYFGNITCEDQGTNYTSNNLTFTVLFYTETAPAYDSAENETVDTTLTGKLATTANVSAVNATLIYNYTSYPSICTLGGSTYSCEATLEPPLVASNNTNIPFYFLYTINLTNGSQHNIVGNSSNQTIEWAYWINNFTSTSDVLEGDTFTAITNLGYAAGVGATVQANVTYNETPYTQTGALPQYSATLTAPQTNVNSTNYTLNSTVYLTHAATSTSRQIQSNDNITSVWRMQLLECGGLSSTVTMNVTTYDEQTEVAISAAHSQAYTCTSGTVERIYSFANSSTEYSEICIYPAWASFQVDSLEFYDGAGYSYTDYFLNNATFSNATIQQSIYLLNDSVGKLTIITVRESGVGVEEAYVFANRYYPGTNTYKTVAMTKTDDSGEGAAILQPNEPWYKFTVIKDGETLLVSASQKVVCEESASTCYVTLNVEDTVIDHWTYFNDITGNCTYQNATNKVVCNWVDTTGLMQWVRLRVTSVGVTATTVLCDVNSTSASGTLYCDIPPTFTGEFNYNLWAKYNPEYPLDSGSVNLGETNIFGDGGIMLAILIFIVLAGVGVWSPPAGILLGLLALVACYGLGIIGSESGIGALAGIGVAGVVMALRMRQ